MTPEINPGFLVYHRPPQRGSRWATSGHLHQIGSRWETRFDLTDADDQNRLST
jgi:hypothetical protein